MNEYYAALTNPEVSEVYGFIKINDPMGPPTIIAPLHGKSTVWQSGASYGLPFQMSDGTKVSAFYAPTMFIEIAAADVLPAGANPFNPDPGS